ncbi:unnamed protein product [Rhizoctonia solani]|uniref:Protein kinase domain-containing protein n=1 Tax=Rhizoctonia solani TaxID=456999 RepID=A0A8H3D0S9_9AGAM|nr:unnamed protein product [Rhizoctonia solani]
MQNFISHLKASQGTLLWPGDSSDSGTQASRSTTGNALASSDFHFHRTFPGIPLGERLIGVYLCQFLRSPSPWGNLYISENHVCFDNRVTSFMLPSRQITRLEKHTTRHALRIMTRTDNYVFMSLLRRDATYLKINETLHWTQPLPKKVPCVCEDGERYSAIPFVDMIVPGTPEAIFYFLFKSEFFGEFMKRRESLMEIHKSDWHPKLSDPTQLMQNTTYINPSSNLVSLKQTSWKHKDETLHADFDNHISIFTTVHKTYVTGPRYVYTAGTKTCITQASATKCRLAVTSVSSRTLREYDKCSTIHKSAIDYMYYTDFSSAVRSYIAAQCPKTVSEDVVASPGALSQLGAVLDGESARQDDNPIDLEHVSTHIQSTGDTPARKLLFPVSYLSAENTMTQSSGRPQQSLVSAGSSRDSVDSSTLSINAGVPSSFTSEFISTSSTLDTGTSQPLNEDMHVPQVHALRQMTSVMYEYLVQHGCPDLISSIDPLGYSPSAVAEGGFGDIWAGRLSKDGAKIAIKVLRFTPISETAAKKELKRITREIYNWSKLDHENINKLVGMVIFRGQLGMVSQWMEHGNLRHYLSRNKNVDRPKLCVQIAKGVSYLHGVNMVHGDLKACNILVSSAGTLKITDFDYSIFPGSNFAFTANTQMGGGTLRWMAPELLLDKDPPQRNVKTDIYALAMTFLIYRKLRRKEHPKRPEELPNIKWGPQMWNLLLQCWDFDPVSRPTANDVLASLFSVVST